MTSVHTPPSNPPLSRLKRCQRISLFTRPLSPESLSPEQERWKTIQTITQTKLIPQAAEGGARIFEHNEEVGYFSNGPSTILRGPSQNPIAHQVAKQWSRYEIIATGAPASLPSGKLIKEALREGDVIIDLRHSQEITPAQLEAYSPILNDSQTLNDQAPIRNQIQAPCLRYEVTHWKDKSSIPLTDLQKLVSLIEEVMTKRREHFPQPRLWVHCQGGVGRTGTLVTALVLQQIFTNQSPQKRNQQEWPDILKETILSMREERSSWFVHTEEQFQLLSQYASFLERAANSSTSDNSS